jgi:hypothetical protein
VKREVSSTRSDKGTMHEAMNKWTMTYEESQKDHLREQVVAFNQKMDHENKQQKEKMDFEALKLKTQIEFEDRKLQFEDRKLAFEERKIQAELDKLKLQLEIEKLEQNNRNE